MKKHFVFLVLWLGFSLVSLAQIPSNPLGLNPSRLRWSQINTNKIQVVFPRGMDSAGVRVARIAEYLWDNQDAGIGDKHKKITVILHNQTTIPNGFVTVGPFRSEYYLTPPQFNNNAVSDWLDLLAVHEYRHVKQFANTDRGITWLTRRLLGSWAWGGIAGAALPRWFWEGDAVLMETVLTEGGRGRLPHFDMEMKALRLAGKRYGYEKASATSLRDFTPNHYSLGYYLVSHARRQYGAEVWQNVVKDAVRYKGIFYPFSRGLRKYAGIRPPQLYRQTMAELDQLWQAEQSHIAPLTRGKTLNTAAKRRFTSYRNPQYMADGSIIVEKSSFEQIPTFYRLYPNGVEEKLTLPGINIADNMTLSVQGNLLCWADLSYGERWGNQNFSVIRTYDLRTQKMSKLTQRSRYFAPCLSPDTRQIIAAEITPELRYRLVLLDAQTGKELPTKFQNPDNLLLTFPRFSPDGQFIVAIAQKDEQQWIVRYDASGGEMTALTRPQKHQISNPCPTDTHVYFSGAHTGINNIFAVEMGKPEQIYQITSVALGAFQPAISPKGTLVFSEFTAMGYNLTEIDLKPDTWQPYSGQESRLNYYAPIAQQEGGSILTRLPDTRYTTRPYRRASGLLNPHSILAYLYPPELGARLLFDNKFSTLSGEVGVYHNNNEKTWTYQAELSFAQFYPWLHAGFNYAPRSRTYIDIYTTPTRTLPRRDSLAAARYYSPRWNERDVYLGISLPLNLTHRTFFQNLRARVDYHWIEVENERDLILNDRFRTLNPLFTSTSLNALDWQLRLSSYQQTALQNILPRWGYLLAMRYRHTLGNSVLKGSVFNLRLDLYLPGLMRNHNFYINTAFMNERFTDNYKFRNIFFYSRGYESSLPADQTSKIGINYSLPLFYPDVPIVSLAFIKRVKANLFYDYTSTVFSSLNAPFTRQIFRQITFQQASAGVELTANVRFFRLIEGDLGVRYSYLFNPELSGNRQAHQFQFLLLRLGI